MLLNGVAYKYTHLLFGFLSGANWKTAIPFSFSWAQVWKYFSPPTFCCMRLSRWALPRAWEISGVKYFFAAEAKAGKNEERKI